MGIIFWSRLLVILTIPAFLLVVYDLLAKMKQSSGRFPTYSVCVHVAGLVLFLFAAFEDNHRPGNGVYIFLVFFVLYWVGAGRVLKRLCSARRTPPPS